MLDCNRIKLFNNRRFGVSATCLGSSAHPWNSNLNAETIIYWFVNLVSSFDANPESINFNRRENVCYLVTLTLFDTSSTLFHLRECIDCKYHFQDNLVTRGAAVNDWLWRSLRPHRKKEKIYHRRSNIYGWKESQNPVMMIE